MITSAHLRLVGTPPLCGHCRVPMFGADRELCPPCDDFIAQMRSRHLCDFPGCGACADEQHRARLDPSDLRFCEL